MHMEEFWLLPGKLITHQLHTNSPSEKKLSYLSPPPPPEVANQIEQVTQVIDSACQSQQYLTWLCSEVT